MDYSGLAGRADILAIMPGVGEEGDAQAWSLRNDEASVGVHVGAGSKGVGVGTRVGVPSHPEPQQVAVVLRILKETAQKLPVSKLSFTTVWEGSKVEPPSIELCTVTRIGKKETALSITETQIRFNFTLVHQHISTYSDGAIQSFRQFLV